MALYTLEPTQFRVLASPSGGAGRFFRGKEARSMTEDVRMLLNALAEVAGELLEKEGFFPPAGAVMTQEGEVNLMQPHDGEEGESPEDQIALLRGAFQAAARGGTIRACAFSVDVRVENPQTEEENEAILVSAEIQEGEAFDIFLPYVVGEEEVEMLQPFAMQREAVVFTDGSDSPNPN